MSEIRAESSSEQRKPGRSKALATTAMTAITTAASTGLGKEIVEPALPLLS